MRITTLGLISLVILLMALFFHHKKRHDELMKVVQGKERMVAIIRARQGCANLTDKKGK